MKRLVFFIYGTLCYLSFMDICLYAVGFLGNFGVSNSIDGHPWIPVGQALAINSLLLVILVVQHSVMARHTFKQWWTQYISKPIERSAYVLCTNIALALLFYGWQPMEGKI